MTVYVLMGVSGAGKSTIGRAVAGATGLPFIDADDLQSPLNIAKMSAGIALTDNDRRPWGEDIAARLKAIGADRPDTDVVLACSALGKGFRRRLRADLNGHVTYLLLHGDPVMIKRRLEARKDHVFRPDMLASQFAAFELPARCERLDIAEPVERQVAIITDIINGGARP